MNTDKEMSELFLNLYMGCMKFKKEKEKTISMGKPVECDEYYKQFEKYSIRYFETKEQDKN